MKKVIVVFFMALLCVSYIQAQVVKSIALKPGIAWANQDWEYQNMSVTDINEYRTGIHVGVNAEFLQHKFLSILAEGGYIEKGLQMEVDVTTPDLPEGTGETKVLKTSFMYIYLSPIVKARLEFGGFTPYVFAGPRADFYLSNKSDWDWSIEDDLNKVIFGMIYGIGIEYIFGSVGVAAIFSQQLDFSMAYDQNPPNSIGLKSIKNNAFVLDIGVKYYFKKKNP